MQREIHKCVGLTYILSKSVCSIVVELSTRAPYPLNTHTIIWNGVLCHRTVCVLNGLRILYIGWDFFLICWVVGEKFYQSTFCF